MFVVRGVETNLKINYFAGNLMFQQIPPAVPLFTPLGLLRIVIHERLEFSQFQRVFSPRLEERGANDIHSMDGSKKIIQKLDLAFQFNPPRCYVHSFFHPLRSCMREHARAYLRGYRLPSGARHHGGAVD